MMFLNVQKPGLAGDPYTYKPDSIMLDLEDAVTENQKDAARFSLHHALIIPDYHGYERIVRVNGLDTDLWGEGVRCAIAGGYDSIRILKTECSKGVATVEKVIVATEREFDCPKGSVLIMAAIRSVRGVPKPYDICTAPERLSGIVLFGGDYTKDLQTNITGTGIELMEARPQMMISARAAGTQCLDTVYTDLDNTEGFRRDVEGVRLMGLNGKSITNPRQVNIVHEIFTPSWKDTTFVQKAVNKIETEKVQGVRVFAVDGRMIDIALYDGVKRILGLAKASGVYKEMQ